MQNPHKKNVFKYTIIVTLLYMLSAVGLNPARHRHQSLLKWLYFNKHVAGRQASSYTVKPETFFL